MIIGSLLVEKSYGRNGTRVNISGESLRYNLASFSAFDQFDRVLGDGRWWILLRGFLDVLCNVSSALWAWSRRGCRFSLGGFLAGRFRFSCYRLAVKKSLLVCAWRFGIFLIAIVPHDELQLAFVCGQHKLLGLLRCYKQSNGADVCWLTLILG